MNAKRRAPQAAWITEDGYFDPGQFPIDSILKQAMSRDEDDFHTGINMLQSMCGHGRPEAGVFLLGLLLTGGDDWNRREQIAGALRNVRTEACADVLFGQLRRIKSSNTTRRYLNEVFRVLANMPAKLVRDGFEELAEDKSLTYKMRLKYRQVLDEIDDARHGF